MPTARAIFSSLLVVCLGLPIAAGAAIIIDHSSTDIWAVPEPAIEQAKTNLHIAYGHTSHGGQIISGMGTSGGAQFDEFMTANGATPELYLWNAGGANGALDLRDTPFSGANDLEPRPLRLGTGDAQLPGFASGMQRHHLVLVRAGVDDAR